MVEQLWICFITNASHATTAVHVKMQEEELDISTVAD